MLNQETLNKISKEVKTILKDAIDDVSLAVSSMILAIIVEDRRKAATGFAKEAQYHISGLVSNLIFFNTDRNNVGALKSIQPAERGVYIALAALGQESPPDISASLLLALKQESFKELELQQLSKAKAASAAELEILLEEFWKQVEKEVNDLDLYAKLFLLAKLDAQKESVIGQLISHSVKKKQTSLFHFWVNKLRKPWYGIKPLKLLLTAGSMLVASSIIPSAFLIDLIVIGLTGLGGLQLSDHLEKLADLQQAKEVGKFVKKMQSVLDKPKCTQLSQEINEKKRLQQQSAKDMDFGKLFDNDVFKDFKSPQKSLQSTDPLDKISPPTNLPSMPKPVKQKDDK